MAENLYAVVREIDEKGNGLTDWEVEFIEGLLKNKHKPLTDRQKKVIATIYHERVLEYKEVKS